MIHEVTGDVSLKSIKRLAFIMKTNVGAVQTHFQLHFPTDIIFHTELTKK